MFQLWTRRRTTSTPPDSGPPFARLFAAALLIAVLLPSCGGSNKTENRIKDINATLTIDPFPGTPDPAIFMLKTPKDNRFPFLEVVQVTLHTTAPMAFDVMNFEFRFDPSQVQVGNVFEINPSVLGDCGGVTACTPLCLNNGADANKTGDLVVGVSRNPDATCPSASLSTDTTLLTLGFIAATTIDPPGSRIELISGPGHGDCEILQYSSGSSGLIDLGVTCVDGNARMTAAR